ncbi:MAG: sigma-70 family RNA polymerase sigma factor [Acidobacteria bacterium]|nr:sigma-70 family RNA polymerase sigma factor [Acidobacteriota bacterium]
MKDPPAGRNAFPTTHWTLVIAAGGNRSSLDRADALERLCGGYWHPVYAFIRRRCYSPEQAQDLTQQFFLRILDGAFFERANSEKGRFRSFLLGAVQNFLSDATDREKSQKRGGGVLPFSLDFATGESNYGREPRHMETPERIFQRKWARTLLDRAMESLSGEFSDDGKLDVFNRIKGYLTGDGDLKYAELGAELNLTESGVKSAIRRMRQRFRDLLRAEVISTVADLSEVDDELRFLLRAIGTQDMES